MQVVGRGVFNVKMEGDVIFQNLDIYAAAGANSALVKGANVIASDGQMTIELDNVVQTAEISAIEITQTVAMPPLRLTFVYPDGTPVAGSLNYQVVPTSGTAEEQPASLDSAVGFRTGNLPASLFTTNPGTYWALNGHLQRRVRHRCEIALRRIKRQHHCHSVCPPYRSSSGLRSKPQ